MADVMLRPIRRLLIANRGEIARRIIRTARRMGIETVAVYADGDARAPFVGEADRAIALDGRSSAQTYLDIGKLMDACKRAGADAVHPGYGFLSENAGFAQAVIEHGLTWVGPPPEAIRRIGDKLSAKRLARHIDVPTLDAYEVGEDDDGAAAAQRIGYPVLIKASAGGGGRGMRVVASPADLAQAIEGARREALAAFGNGTVFLERWLARVAPRRDPDPRRPARQPGPPVRARVLDPAPAPEDRRGGTVARRRRRAARAHDAGRAAGIGRTIGYDSAGTVEFLVSGQEFFFLEVNTRLQVEHPVTEAITGLDLVREQLRIAEGEALGYGQPDVSHERSRDRGAPVRRGPGAGLPADAGHGGRVGARRGRGAAIRLPASNRAPRSASNSTR